MKKYNNLELRVYNIFGVPIFRKAVLQFEKIRHIRSKGKNVNYHLGGGGCSSIIRFFSFLSYNAFLHIMSICFIILYKLMAQLLHSENLFVDYAVIFLFILNVYCIMLQRWNVLHMNNLLNHLLKQRERRVSKLMAEFSSGVSPDYSIDERRHDMQVLLKLQNSVNHSAEIQLTREDYVCINRMSKYFHSEKNKKYMTTKFKREEGEKTFSDMLEYANLSSKVYTKAERRVKALQYFFRKRKTVLNEKCVIVTDNNEQDKAFRSLFPYVTPDNFIITLEALIAALKYSLGVNDYGEHQRPST